MMIDATARIPLDADLDADLDAVLAIADDERLAFCESCHEFVPEAESGESELTGETICLRCHMAEQDEQAAIRAEIDADLDLLHAEAARYRAAGIDPQMAYHLARHDRRR